MATLLLLGNFQNRRKFVASLRGHHLVLCHSLDAFQRIWSEGKPSAVLIAADSMGPALAQFLAQATERFPGFRATVILETPETVPTLPTEKVLILSGVTGASWEGRFSRWLENKGFKERRGPRQACRGGMRLKDSDYSRQPRGRKFYGEVQDLSGQGARVRVPESLAADPGEFFEITLRDSEGRARSYHAQVRWQKKDDQGGTELGLQLMAEAA